MSVRALRIDEDGDLDVGGGFGVTLDEGTEAVANLIRGLFDTDQGEFFADQTAGIAWREYILGQPNFAAIPGYLAEEINAVAGVAAVDAANITIDVDPATRIASIAIKVQVGSRETILTFDTTLSNAAA